jgi:hypothetical protein
MKKILITHNDIHFIGYLIKDQKTKFVAKNETKVLTYHYPKASYSYKIVEEK